MQMPASGRRLDGRFDRPAPSLGAAMVGDGRSMDPLLLEDPRSVGDFRLAARLGMGGMGVVYLGYAPSGDPVAVKVVRGELSAQPEFRSRFIREVDAIAAVRGTFTARLVRADTASTPQWVATEYVPGPTLARHVEGHGPLAVDQVRLLAVALLDALRSVHEVGIIHRDLKPSNVILSPTGPRVIDFGIARALEATSLTATGQRVGSLGWMAPEQLSGDAAETDRTDVHAWAAVVCFAATGSSPFGDGRPEAVAWRVAHTTPSLDALPEGLDDLREVLSAALNPAPHMRPDIATLRTALGARVSSPDDVTRVVGQEWTVVTPTFRLPQPAEGDRRRGRVLPVVITTVLAVFGGIAWTLWPSDGTAGITPAASPSAVTSTPDLTADTGAGTGESTRATEPGAIPGRDAGGDPVPIGPTGSFAMSSKGVQATLLSRETDSESVTTIEGVVTQADAMEYCSRDPGGSYPDTQTGLQDCVQEVLATEDGEIYQARAQCAQELLQPPLPEMSYRQFMDGTPGSEHWWRLAVHPDEDDWLTGDGYSTGPAWQNITTGETRNSTGAEGGYVMYDQFVTACETGE